MYQSDQLNWEMFNINSSLDLNNLPKKCEPFNRLICHTTNFFVIAGYGSFNEGYLMLISKNLISSFALIPETLINEFLWLKNFITNVLISSYSNYDIAIFEHGMCACLGGLDRAHLHFMPYKSSNNSTLKTAIDNTLARRRTGIKSVIFENKKFFKAEDIDMFLHTQSKSHNQYDFQIEGHQFTFNDIKSNYRYDKYPLVLSGHDSTPYIFFECAEERYSFITTVNIETQFGREIVFNIDYNNIQSINELIKNNKIKTKYENNFLWRWQDFKFEKNIINTLHLLSKYINLNCKDSYNRKYDFYSFS